MDKEREEHWIGWKVEEKRGQYQAQAKESHDARREKEWKEKERSQEKEREKEKDPKRSASKSKNRKGAESRVAEPASRGTADKQTAKPKTTKSASVSGDSAASTSKGLGPSKAEPKWKSNWEMMAYLNALHVELYPSPKAWELKVRITSLYQSFHARERLRKNSYLQGVELQRKQQGYSRKKKWLHDQRVAEDHSQMPEFELLAMQVADEDQYDSEADEEEERLEQALEREKVSQVR